MNHDDALARLKTAGPLLHSRGVLRAGVFGSVARGSAGPESDVDVLVELDPKHLPGWEYFGLGDELAAVMGCPVDVCTPNSLHRLMRDEVLREVVYAEI